MDVRAPQVGRPPRVSAQAIPPPRPAKMRSSCSSTVLPLSLSALFFFYEHVAAASWKKGATVQPPRTRWTQGCLRGAQGVAGERGLFRPPRRLPGMQEIEPTSDACPMTRAVRNNWLPARAFGTAVRNVAPIRPYRSAAGWPFVSGLIARRARFAACGGGTRRTGCYPRPQRRKRRRSLSVCFRPRIDSCCGIPSRELERRPSAKMSCPPRLQQRPECGSRWTAVPRHERSNPAWPLSSRGASVAFGGRRLKKKKKKKCSAQHWFMFHCGPQSAH